MNAKRLIGLGKPQLIGKHALFQPPVAEKVIKSQVVLPSYKSKIEVGSQVKSAAPPRRVRTTIELTGEALQIIQRAQQEYRLRTGKVLPLWQAVSQAIEAYGKNLQE